MNPLCVFTLHCKRGIPYRKKMCHGFFWRVICTTLLSMHKTVHSSALAYILFFSRSRSFCTSCMRYTKWNCPLLQRFCWKPFVAQTSVTKSTTGRFILIVDFTLISISWWWSLIRNMKEVENIIQLPIELFSFPQYSRLPAQARHYIRVYLASVQNSNTLKLGSFTDSSCPLSSTVWRHDMFSRNDRIFCGASEGGVTVVA